MNIIKSINEISYITPDKSRCLKNLWKMQNIHPDFLEQNISFLSNIAMLFACSQFLADYSFVKPESLSLALKKIDSPVSKKEVIKDYKKLGKARYDYDYKKQCLNILRTLKKDYLLRITLRDLSEIITTKGSIYELSVLADSLIEIALNMSFKIMKDNFGDMKDDSFAIIGLGKLGAEELNYSSDIDIMTLYHSEKKISSGVRTATNILKNRINSHEYFCKLTEIITHLLQSITEDGICYRVDLRLRPDGQKGAISLPLNACLQYYESWGKSWERIALIRSRYIAGDTLLGSLFIKGTEPFVWKKSLDYNDIEEIRILKKRIDNISNINDIKRGYGGIREIEFFVHAFQLLYGGDRINLRKRNISDTLNELFIENLISKDDIDLLSSSYFFLRKIEHFLQMRDDNQTYIIPSSDEELEILAKKMRFENKSAFISKLKLQRFKVRDIYNLLFKDTVEINDSLLSIFEELPDEAIINYLEFKGFLKSREAFKNIRILQEQLATYKTLHERISLRKLIAYFLDEIIKTTNKDRALLNLINFIDKIGEHASFTGVLKERHDLIEIIIKTFSSSSYLTKSLLNIENIESIFDLQSTDDNFKHFEETIKKMNKTNEIKQNIRKFKSYEELKSGIFFIAGILDVYSFMERLSIIPDVILKTISSCLLPNNNFALVAFGSYGAKELNIGSDLDLVFIASENMRYNEFPEKIITLLTEYTDTGFAYKVDMRLRPDGSKGVLVNSIEGYEEYYLKSAKAWEIQSLIKARPVAGEPSLINNFEVLRKKIILKRRKDIRLQDIQEMRQKIIKEISKEKKGYDLKLGPGGIKEIEFIVQYIQLKYADIFPEIIIQNTFKALKKIASFSLIDKSTSGFLIESHRFLRTIDTILRMNNLNVLQINSDIPDIIIKLVNLNSRDELIEKIEKIRFNLSQISAIIYK